MYVQACVSASEMGQHLEDGRGPPHLKKEQRSGGVKRGKILPSLILQVSEEWVIKYSKMQKKQGLRKLLQFSLLHLPESKPMASWGIQYVLRKKL